jgi:hypothetical protein
LATDQPLGTIPNTAKPQQLALPLPELPTLDSHLYAIHYSQELQANCPAQTPPVSAIIVQHVLSEQQHTFSAFHIAEQDGIAPPDLRARLPELEKQLLTDYYGLVERTPDIVWLHWAMRQPTFGFEVLAQRARLHGIAVPEMPMNQRFDLSGYLKQRFGEEYVPHPRFPNAIKANGLMGPQLLDEQAAAAAWARGEYTHLTQSLAFKVDAIADMFLRVCKGTFRTEQAATPVAANVTPGRKGKRIHERMLVEIRDNPSAALDRTLREWAAFLNCSPSTVQEMPAWKKLEIQREGMRLARQIKDKKGR